MKEIIVKGAIGNTDRQNRDNARVISGGGISINLKSVNYKDPPKVLRKWKRK